jgi:hypothetical protein
MMLSLMRKEEPPMAMPTEASPPEADISSSEDAPRSSQARRRALIAIGGLWALILLIWFGDALSGLLPQRPFVPTIHQAGGYHVRMALAPDQPHAGRAVRATWRITDAARHPVTTATLTYQWQMVGMDMGTTRGMATATAGQYMAVITPTMGGEWQITVRVHIAGSADGTTAFTVLVQG